MKGFRITKNQLIDVAIQSVRQKDGLSMFWDYVNQAKIGGLLKMTIDQVKGLVRENEALIFGKGIQYQDQDERLSDTVSTFGLEDSSYQSRIIEGSALDGLMAKVKDITPLRAEIPTYMDVIQPRPARVYLLDSLGLWPLFKVVGVFGEGRRETGQLYLVGRDRHTKQPFALGIPNGFVDMPFDACLRWTLDAHKGDISIEV